MSTSAARPVLVGIDYSADSVAAVELAAWEAQRRRLPLRLLHALNPAPAYGPGAGAGWLVGALVRDSAELLSDTTNRIQRRHPGLEISQTVVTGGPAGALIADSRQAALVVLGARGTGGFPELLVGSVSTQVATHAHAPVIVVRRGTETIPPTGPVVVGVDGSARADAAIGFAFEEAEARGAGLIAVYSWDIPPAHNLGPITRWHYDPAQAQDEAERLLAEAMAGWADKYPDVPVTRRAVHSFNAAETIREAAQGASLLALGSRGHGGFVGLLLGSVSRTMLSHAGCSVAIVHEH